MTYVCSKGQCEHGHDYAGGLDLTSVEALRYFGRLVNFSTWVLVWLGLECWPVDHGYPIEEVQDDQVLYSPSHGCDEYQIYI